MIAESFGTSDARLREGLLPPVESDEDGRLKAFGRTYRERVRALAERARRAAGRLRLGLSSLTRRRAGGAPARAYDDRRLLFDLGRAARLATNIEQLYELIVNELAAALGASHVSVFVRDERTGDFVLRVCSAEASAGGAGRRLILAKDSLAARRLRNLSAPLGITPRDLDAWLRAPGGFDRETRERECDMLREINARLLVGVMMHDRLVGVLSVGPRADARHFSSDDKRMLMSVANQLAFVIVNAQLAERTVAEESLRRELMLAREVQQRLLPARPPAASGLSLSGFCEPASAVGGDYYDFLRLGEGQLGLAVGDVAGKGVGAALLMSNVQASWRSQILSRGEGSLPELVRAMNRLIFQATGPAGYVTFFCARLDEGARSLTYVNAGHNPPLLVRAGEVGELRDGGPVLGIFEDCEYEQGSVSLESGDVVVAYTDGLTEALNASGEEFGVGRLCEALAGDGGREPAEVVRDRVVARVRAWCAGTPQHDDLTFVVLVIN